MFVAPRVNKPPRADISPKEQTITLPTNEVVLDGSSEYKILYSGMFSRTWHRFCVFA